ncbi:radical SAM/SPASM domain-containing protein [Bradyrhizobium sp. CCBAU 25338]|uniref:radical SAM/SPASM domain-containing protein n=1 Tax=Bradyrhizobium sp. CCBAU 25338 TaxID=1641877 RepID=UPI0023049FF9|nr:radical SAM protein [Bradyrhizobium sp. CCBAU 25338]
MGGQVTFRLDDPVPLPDDVHIWIPEGSASLDQCVHPETSRKPDYVHIAGLCDGASCANCDCLERAPSVELPPIAAAKASDRQRFLAVSPKAATYAAFDMSFLPSFLLLRDGHSPRTVIEFHKELYGTDSTSAHLKSFFETIVLRNMLNSATTKEDLPDARNLHLYVTNRCNLRCSHCYMSSGQPLPQGEIDTEQRLRAIDLFSEVSPNSKVTLSGGEALTDPDIFVLIDHAKNRGHRVELFSNGLLIRKQNVQRIVNSVDQLQISIDGTDSTSNDPIRGKGSFDRIVAAIKLVDRADRSANPNFFYRIGMTLTRSNYENIETNLVGFLGALELQSPHRISIAVVSGIGRAGERPEISADVDDLPLIQARIMKSLINQGRVKWPSFTVNRYSKSCGIGMSIAVAADGRIYPCSVTEQPAIGAVGDADAKAAMERVGQYTEEFNVDRVSGCSTCSLRYFCQGKCRVANLHSTGSMARSTCTSKFKAARARSLMANFDSFVAH